MGIGEAEGLGGERWERLSKIRLEQDAAEGKAVGWRKVCVEYISPLFPPPCVSLMSLLTCRQCGATAVMAKGG